MSTDLKVTTSDATDTDTLTPQADLTIAQTNSTGSASYQVAATNPFPSLQFGARIVSSDFNGDGNLDILYQTGNTAGQGIFLALGNGNGTFQTAIAQPSGAAFTTGPLTGIQLSGVIAGSTLFAPDLGGNGDIVVNPGGGATPTIYQSNGTSYVQISNPFPAQQFTGRFVFADFNGDGRVDALNQTGNTSATGITLYLNNGDGTFTTFAQPTNGAFTAGPLTGIEFTQVVSSTVFAVSTSGSGAANLIIDDQGAGAVPKVYLNNGSGFTQITSPFPAQQFTSRFVFGDFSGDGQIDVLNQTGNQAGQGITLYEYTGNGTFTSIAKPDDSTAGAGDAPFASGPFAGIDFTQILNSQFLVGDFFHNGSVDIDESQSGASRELVQQVPQTADLSVTINDGVTSVVPGTIDSYTITVTNNGPDTVTSLTLFDAIPASLSSPVFSPPSQGTYDPVSGLWSGLNLASGQSLSITLSAAVNPNATSTISNTVTVLPVGATDTNPGNNSATDTNTVTPIADLSLSETVSNPTPNVGDQITFTETLSNLGPNAATGVQVTDMLPAGLSLVSAAPSQGTYNSTTGLWTVGTVNSGAPQTLTITATVVSPVPQTNTAAISHADQFDPNTSNNTANATETPQADLSLSETVSNPTPNVGDQITFTETLSNLGPDAATGVQVTDLLPAGLSFVSATPSQGTYNSNTGIWTVGTVSSGVPQTLSITAKVVSPTQQTNTGTISHADQFDPNTANNTASETIVPCYCTGTLILTDRGEVPVETLAIGDKVMTADGVARPIRWIGRRSYSGRFARGNHVLPICIKTGALNENLPRRDLWISPNHAMFLHGALIEAQDLVNGVSIVRAPSIERVDYFHIELETHDVIVAEGALSESFVDDDSRGMFQNAHEFQALYPNERPRPDPYCAPRLAFGAQVEAARRQIAQRAGIPYKQPTAESTPRALVVDNQIPKIGHDGGANAILDHMRALQAAGFQVSFLALRHCGTDAHALSSLGVTPLWLPANGSVSEVMRVHAGQFDLVYLHRLESAMHCLKLARQYFDAQIVYSVADLHHLRLKTQSELDHEHASELMQQAQCVALHELAAALSSDCVITHSDSEAEKLEQLASIAADHKVRVVPWSVPPAAVQKPFADRCGIAFIGSFTHLPNVDAARWLVDEIMPLVWREAPDLRCLIAGSDMSEDLHQQLAGPGVKVLGRVERLGEVLEQVRLTIAPLRFGAGLKDKVLRSMAAGLPCIGTATAFDGMQGLPEAIRNVCQRDTASGLAAAIVSMHRDEAANTSCSHAGLNYMDAFYNEARIEALIREIAQPALDRFRAKAKSKSPACEVLQFVAASARASIAANAPGRERRIVFN